MPIVETQVLSVRHQEANQMGTPYMSIQGSGHLVHRLRVLVQLPADEPTRNASPGGWIIGIVAKVLLHPHTGILPDLLIEVFGPGFLRRNLKDDMGELVHVCRCASS